MEMAITIIELLCRFLIVHYLKIFIPLYTLYSSITLVT